MNTGLDAFVSIALPRMRDDAPAWPAIVERFRSAAWRLEEHAVLSTCERVELIGAGDHSAALTALDDLRPCVRVGEQAARHVLRVASGLESRIAGESHILGQVRSAFDGGTRGTALAALARRAVRVGRTVRSKTALGQLGVSYATLAADRAVRDGVEKAVVIGSGALARDVATLLTDHWVREIVIASGHPDRAQARAPTHARVVHLSVLAHELANADALISATAAPRALVEVSHVSRRARPLLAVDLGVPRNIDAGVGDAPGVTLVDLDELAPHEGPTMRAVREAEALVEHQLGMLRRDLAKREVMAA